MKTRGINSIDEKRKDVFCEIFRKKIYSEFSFLFIFIAFLIDGYYK